jgi:hypothetical protein
MRQGLTGEGTRFVGEQRQIVVSMYSIVLGAHKLRARRTVCKSVFFSKDKLLMKDSGPIPASRAVVSAIRQLADRAEIIEKR